MKSASVERLPSRQQLLCNVLGALLLSCLSCRDAKSLSAAAAEAMREGQDARAEELWDQACEKGLGDACHNLGVLRERQQRLDAAQKAYTRGCALQVLTSCAAYGFVSIARGDTDEAVRSCKNSCVAGDAESCVCLGLANQPVQGTDAGSNQLALAQYERACELGSGRGCTFAGEIAAFLAPEKTAALFRLGCERDHGAGCVEQAKRIIKGIDVASSAERGVELLRRACHLGEQRGCALLDQNGLPH